MADNNNYKTERIKDSFKRKQSEIYSGKAKEDGLDNSCVYFEYPITLQASKKTWFLNKFNSPHRNFILDVGCYKGEYLRYLSKKFRTCGVGIDISETALRYSIKSDNYKNKYIVSDAEALPFKDSVFDGVLLISILEHLNDPARCISEVRRVLKNEGGCLIHLPVRDCKYSLQWLRYKIYPKSKDILVDDAGHNYEKMLTMDELLFLLRKEGFFVAKKLKTGIFIQCLHDWYIVHFLSEILYKRAKRFIFGFSADMRNYGKRQEDTSVVYCRDQAGIFRKIYSKFILPMFKILIFIERLFMGKNLGYCAYLLAIKKP